LFLEEFVDGIHLMRKEVSRVVVGHGGQREGDGG
jgi:hypothetical protein